MSKPPKIVIPGMNRGAGIPPGYILGRLPGTGKGPAQLLDLTSVKKVGIATTAGVVASTSQAISIAQSDTASLSAAVSSADSGQSTSLSQISSSLSGAISSTTSLSSAVSTVISGSISTVTSSVASLSTAVSTVDAGKANLAGGNGFTGNQSLDGDLTLLSGTITAAPESANYLGNEIFLNVNSPTDYGGWFFSDELGVTVTALFFGGSADPRTYLNVNTFILEDGTGSMSMIFADSSTVKLNAANVTELTVTAAGVDFRQAPTVGGVPLTNSLSTAISTVDSNQSTSLSQISSSLSGAISSTSSLSSGVSTVDNNQSTSLSQISSSLSGAISSTTSLSTAGPVVHPGYVAGNWYSPVRANTFAAGAAPPLNSIRILPFTISKPITISDLGARVTTLFGGGNFQLAIYANNAATGRPTGTALCSTGNISTAATGPVSATVGSSVLLPPGAYWMAINQDNSTAVYQTISNTGSQQGFLIGATALSNVTSGAGAGSLYLTIAQTFGTWPDLTSAAFTEATNLNSALVFLKAA